MDWLNYHHLLYFWTVAREGSIARACQTLHIAQPTVSSQLRKLERSLGGKLFEREGRRLKLTELGNLVLHHAEEIFASGRELLEAVKGRPSGKPLRFVVGVPDGLPKLIVYRLLKPAFELPEPVHLICREGNHDELMIALASHELDLVLSDIPAGANVRIKAFSHLLGECGISFFGGSELARKSRRTFPESLSTTPLLLPTGRSSLRRALDQWFDEQAIRPHVYAEFEDSALLKVFGQEGLGLFPAPAAIRREIERQYRVKLVGTIDDLREKYFAISVERRIRHPAVLAISTAARQELFFSKG